jgi:hypothetical protein
MRKFFSAVVNSLNEAWAARPSVEGADDVTVVAAGNGLFGPTIDDVFRAAILLVGCLNVVAVVTALVLLRRYVRLLLDVEHYAREARNRLDRDVTAIGRAIAAVQGDIAQLRQDVAVARPRQESAAD